MRHSESVTGERSGGGNRKRCEKTQPRRVVLESKRSVHHPTGPEVSRLSPGPTQTRVLLRKIQAQHAGGCSRDVSCGEGTQLQGRQKGENRKFNQPASQEASGKAEPLRECVCLPVSRAGDGWLSTKCLFLPIKYVQRRLSPAPCQHGLAGSEMGRGDRPGGSTAASWDTGPPSPVPGHPHFVGGQGLRGSPQ